MRKTKVAVVGPESSGTRLMTRILTDAGADALHRSFPYGAGEERRWPNLDVEDFDPDYMVWMTRDWWATTASQVAVPHVADFDTAWQNVRHTQTVLARLSQSYKTFQVSYESLVQRPHVVVRNLTSALNLKMPPIEQIVDGNSKWLGKANVVN